MNDMGLRDKLRDKMRRDLTPASLGSFVRYSVVGLLAASLGLSVAVAADDEFLSLMGAEGVTAPNDPTARPKAGTPLKKALLGLIGKTTPEQNIFLQFIEEGELEKALFQWPSAFEGTEFARSANGHALNAYLLFKNGVEVFATEALLSVDKPKAISSEIVRLWVDAAPENHLVWSYVGTGLWNATWTDIFGVSTEIRVRGREVYGAEQLEVVKDLIKRTPRETRERAWMEWQLVLALATGGDSGTAAKALAILMKSPKNPISQDLMTLTAARLLYQNGYLDAAAKYYEKVPKSSDDWFDAQEEMAWAAVRKGEPQDAIAITKTLMTPAFVSQVGPEALFVRSLALLKVCDYPEVVKTLDAFRDRYRERAKVMLLLSENANTPETQKFIDRSKSRRVKLLDLGGDAAKLPRFITRDELVSQMIATEAVLEKESRKFGELYARSLSSGTGKVGFQARLEELKKSVERRAQAARSATLGRVKTLAEDEVNEIAQTLQKLHIVEAEVLQQISLADRVAGATEKSKIAEKKGTTGSKSADRIWFPANTKEVWFDELANYSVDLKKGCQSVKR
jgi:tetratricopeptide (TPR) repeat protein